MEVVPNHLWFYAEDMDLRIVSSSQSSEDVSSLKSYSGYTSFFFGPKPLRFVYTKIPVVKYIFAACTQPVTQ